MCVVDVRNVYLPNDISAQSRRRPRLFSSAAAPPSLLMTQVYLDDESMVSLCAESTPSRPPLIDSILLRFLGKQKQTLQFRQNAGTNSTSSRVERWPVSVEPASSSVVATPPTDSTVPTISAGWWRWGQYQSDRVAQLLLDRDANLDPAQAALVGRAVQSQALQRNARRRVRDFLKHRDDVWNHAAATTTTTYSPPTGIRPGGTSSSSNNTAAPYRLEETINVMMEYGLTVKDVAEILLHSPGIALMRPRPLVDGNNTISSSGETIQDTMDRSFVDLLSTRLELRRYDARKILRTCPGLLTMTGSRHADQVVRMMQSLGVSCSSLARDKTALPALLSRSPDALFRLVAFLSSDAVRMPVSQIGPLLRRTECLELLNAVAPVRRALHLNETDGTDPEVLSALRARQSQEQRDLVNRVYDQMSSTAWTLRHRIGTADLGRVVAAYPSVLLLNAQEQILPNAQYLMNDLGVWKDDLPRVLQLYPALLGTPIEQMQAVTNFLLALEVDRDILPNIFRSFPALLTMDVDQTMKPVVEYLRTAVGVRNVGRFVSRLPPLLGYSIEELRPKWEFLQQVGLSNARFELTRFPAYFSYPLERVIKSRYTYLNQVKKVPPQLVSLDQVLRFGDKDFAVKVAGDADGGQSYLAFVRERHSKSSKHNRARKKKPTGTSSTANSER
jgi:mTERF